MSGHSDTFTLNIYEERLDDETALDLSCKELEEVPKLSNLSLIIIYLQNNRLTTLPDDFFPSLTSLVYLDLRDNRLMELPKTIKNHQALTHLLLQNNCLTGLPDELGTISLKVLQISGNPLMYPPEDVLIGGKARILKYLHDQYVDSVFDENVNSDSAGEATKDATLESMSYNSVLDSEKINESKLKIELSEKCDSDEEYYAKIKGKCRKLDKSRHKTVPSYSQSGKYLKPIRTEGKNAAYEKIKKNYFKQAALKRRTELLATREKILQERKTLEQLRKWRQNYRAQQFFNPDPSYRLSEFPYDTSPEYMTLLTREDIEKDLPDKYRKTLQRRSRPTVARKVNSDVHLAMKIKKLFENLEKLDLNTDGMTPRTEQKILMNEIHKISEIKQKLAELSTSNMTSVTGI